ncbi:hypothetical protein K458DRAFT_195864 [Lentithecium fluviatile CBS 122367]|uniref:Uncharacterized protein n=1 Tax=Lentithecium fluviatile CBS 122367 TaxID=1168545 RepID=A0A6G1IDG4_9PLEO|nr:hypothetical protein K458DRAFT_195864 [Lentithecium fluviatile CBS 122367]
MARIMISLSSLCLLASTALALPQAHLAPALLSRRAVPAPQDTIRHSLQREDAGTDIHLPLRVSERTDSIGVGEQASVSPPHCGRWGKRWDAVSWN